MFFLLLEHTVLVCKISEFWGLHIKNCYTLTLIESFIKWLWCQDFKTSKICTHSEAEWNCLEWNASRSCYLTKRVTFHEKMPHFRTWRKDLLVSLYVKYYFFTLSSQDFICAPNNLYYMLSCIKSIDQLKHSPKQHPPPKTCGWLHIPHNYCRGNLKLIIQW